MRCIRKREGPNLGLARPSYHCFFTLQQHAHVRRQALVFSAVAHLSDDHHGLFGYEEVFN